VSKHKTNDEVGGGFGLIFSMEIVNRFEQYPIDTFDDPAANVHRMGSDHS